MPFWATHRPPSSDAVRHHRRPVSLRQVCPPGCGQGPRGTGEVRRGEAPATPAPGQKPGGPRPEEPAENGAFRVRNEAPQGHGDDVPTAVRPTREARPPGPPVPTPRPNGRTDATDPVRSASTAVALPRRRERR